MNRIIALCGAPGAGKTTVADFLVMRAGAELVDDGLVLRKGAMELFGLSWEQVSTAEGKASTVTVCGKPHTVRRLLGDTGALLEKFYGDQFMPEAAIRAIREPEALIHVFPSVRKNQGLTYRALGGMVIEVTRPGYVPVNDFDHYDKSRVTHTITNDGTPEDLMDQVDAFLTNVLGIDL